MAAGCKLGASRKEQRRRDVEKARAVLNKLCDYAPLRFNLGCGRRPAPDRTAPPGTRLRGNCRYFSLT